eukprot:gnl/Dysnectes_brevis/1516_a1719_1076.p1 GENE.gnl/Dysnectes_brevis/1516_a1719_1076~~gnl/Dysnectes_brevis/1516_a1719_1076.p1  ORF type:complete len:689 (+),score=222.42 gnl/Dysnectes_brevis/1516_a1719_1076:61-2127(+)
MSIILHFIKNCANGKATVASPITVRADLKDVIIPQDHNLLFKFESGLKGRPLNLVQPFAIDSDCSFTPMVPGDHVIRVSVQLQQERLKRPHYLEATLCLSPGVFDITVTPIFEDQAVPKVLPSPSSPLVTLYHTPPVKARARVVRVVARPSRLLDKVKADVPCAGPSIVPSIDWRGKKIKYRPTPLRLSTPWVPSSNLGNNVVLAGMRAGAIYEITHQIRLGRETRQLVHPLQFQTDRLKNPYTDVTPVFAAGPAPRSFVVCHSSEKGCWVTDPYGDALLCMPRRVLGPTTLLFAGKGCLFAAADGQCNWLPQSLPSQRLLECGLGGQPVRAISLGNVNTQLDILGLLPDPLVRVTGAVPCTNGCVLLSGLAEAALPPALGAALSLSMKAKAKDASMLYASLVLLSPSLGVVSAWSAASRYAAVSPPFEFESLATKPSDTGTPGWHSNTAFHHSEISSLDVSPDHCLLCLPAQDSVILLESNTLDKQQVVLGHEVAPQLPGVAKDFRPLAAAFAGQERVAVVGASPSKGAQLLLLSISPGQGPRSGCMPRLIGCTDLGVSAVEAVSGRLIWLAPASRVSSAPPTPEPHEPEVPQTPTDVDGTTQTLELVDLVDEVDAPVSPSRRIDPVGVPAHFPPVDGLPPAVLDVAVALGDGKGVWRLVELSGGMAVFASKISGADELTLARGLYR